MHMDIEPEAWWERPLELYLADFHRWWSSRARGKEE